MSQPSAPYSKVLVAVDQTPAAARILTQGAALCADPGRQLHLVHVGEHPLLGHGAWNEQSNDNQIREALYPWLKELAEPLLLSAEQVHLRLGRPADEITRLAADLATEVIVLGSHGRYGWRLLLGSTANSVLHEAPCDVLTVRLQREE